MSGTLSTRRTFVATTGAAVLAGLRGSTVRADTAPAVNLPNVLGPRAGYSPQVGSFVSMLTWMREQNGVLKATEKLSQQDLDSLFDANANTIGALMLHLAAVETYFQMNTFGGMKWGTWPQDVSKKWHPAMELGSAGREAIKGHDREYYVDSLRQVREKTLAEFRERDDAWLMAVDKEWPWGPTNNLCKWFHVCEHEAHHTGQIALLRKRLPGAKPDGGSGA